MMTKDWKKLFKVHDKEFEINGGRIPSDGNLTNGHTINKCSDEKQQKNTIKQSSYYLYDLNCILDDEPDRFLGNGLRDNHHHRRSKYLGTKKRKGRRFFCFASCWSTCVKDTQRGFLLYILLLFLLTGLVGCAYFGICLFFGSQFEGEMPLSWDEFRPLLKVYNCSTDARRKRVEGSTEIKMWSLLDRLLMNVVRPNVTMRTFGCLRDGCRGLEIEDLIYRGWENTYRSGFLKNTITFQDRAYNETNLFTDTTTLNQLANSRPDILDKIHNKFEGIVYISAIDGVDEIGGNKGRQLRSKIIYTQEFGCDYSDLAIQPAQYRLYVKNECDELVRTDNQHGIHSWLLKPIVGSQGKKISFHKTVQTIRETRPEFFPCASHYNISFNNRYLVQEYIKNPLLISGSKFDIRIYMLIARTNPAFVFYHIGYLRRSLSKYDLDTDNRQVHLTNTHFQSKSSDFKFSTHIWSFEAFQEYLKSNGITGAHYIDTILNPYIKSVVEYIFYSGRKKFKLRSGSYQIIGLDFMIDSDFHVHFIEVRFYCLLFSMFTYNM